MDDNSKIAQRSPEWSEQKAALELPDTLLGGTKAMRAAGVSGWSYLQGIRLDAAHANAAKEIQAEQVAHAATRAELATAQRQIAGLTVELTLAREATAAVQDSLQDALAREAEAVGAALARKKILDAVVLRTRTEEEKQEVVDDKTRSAVAGRLNRPL